MTQLPSPHQPDPRHRKRLRPKTYSVAVYLVVAVVVLQVVMLISVFWLRAMVVSVNVHLPKAQAGRAGAPAYPTLAGTGPETPSTQPDLPSLPSLEIAGPHPARLSVPGVSDKLEQIGNMNEEAKVFLHQNDTHAATEILIKAEDLDPRNPTTLKSLAEVYNLMNDSVRSRIYWQRLADLGPGVGTVYAVAKDHVLLFDSGPGADPLKDSSNLNRVIYVGSVEKSPPETRNGSAQFHLRAELRRKNPKMPDFDQKKLQPYVIFYQQMPDGNLVPDLGQRKGAFDDTFLFWGNKISEAFGVDYLMPISGSPGPNNTTQGEYYGFVIGIYYNKILQDVRSEPSDLIARVPLPLEIE